MSGLPDRKNQASDLEHAYRLTDMTDRMLVQVRRGGRNRRRPRRAGRRLYEALAVDAAPDQDVCGVDM
jgi:hypothetical protein